jgi:ADP-ribosylglycohydrolase
MMSSELQSRARNMILGALVADAATMGLHWIYDQDRIRSIAPDVPEFVGPDPAHFDGVPAFFAHEGRASGEQSQYGDQALVMARALAANGGRYDPMIYASHFRAHFGYGGKYVGYIDGATRDSLDNFRRAEDALMIMAKEIPFDGDPRYVVAMVNKANVAIAQHQGDAMRAAFEKSVRIIEDSDALVAYGFKVLDLILSAPPVYGAKDMQHPAIAKLPALVAMQTLAAVDEGALLQSVESAVRMTSDHPVSIAFGPVCAKMMQAALTGASMEKVVAAGRAVADADIDALLATAMTMTDQSSEDVAKHFGLACDLTFGVPIVAHTLVTAPDFTTAIRRNILSGGDNCGRAILLGAIAGAAYGVGGERGIPQAWIDKLVEGDAVRGLLDDLIG